MQLNYGRRIFGLDLMRAFAIVLVVFSHIIWIIPNKTGLIPDLMSISGVVGVETFFVLSGFLIGRIIYNIFDSENYSRKDILYFWIRRWFRTLPNYYLALILNVAVTLFIGLNLPRNLWQFPFFLQNLAWQPPAFFYESWSLSIEEYAYIIGPLFIYGLIKLRPNESKSKLFLLATLIIISAFLFTKIWYNLNDTVRTMQYWNINLKSSVIYRIDAIYYGVLAAYLCIKKPIFWKKSKIVGFVFGVVIFVSLNLGIPLNRIFIESYPFFWNVMYLPINSIAIAFMLPLLSNWNNASNILLFPITWISLLSYSIYVLHYSVILQLLKYFIPTENLVGMDIIVYIIVYLSFVILISYVVYKFFERPLTNFRDHPKIKSKFR